LPFHVMKRPAFPRPQRPCDDLVHVFSTSKPAASTAVVENLFIEKAARARPPMRACCSGAKLFSWKRH
jgi:hypothetical protein